MMQLIFTGTVVVVPLSGRFFPVLFGDGGKTEKSDLGTRLYSYGRMFSNIGFPLYSYVSSVLTQSWISGVVMRKSLETAVCY